MGGLLSGRRRSPGGRIASASSPRQAGMTGRRFHERLSAVPPDALGKHLAWRHLAMRPGEALKSRIERELYVGWQAGGARDESGREVVRGDHSGAAEDLRVGKLGGDHPDVSAGDWI